ncbi:ribonuclease H-like domain-containing protein [Tanacetum coccineum]
MVNRFCVGSNRHPQRLNLHVSTLLPLPKSYSDSFNDPNWQNAMNDEYNVLIKNNTWTLVPLLVDANVVRCMWLFRHKHLADGTLSRYKARLVANGSTQVSGIDVDETFSPVVKSATVHTVLSLATSRHWHVYHLDVKNAFIHGDLYKTVYMHQSKDVDDIVLTASSEALLQHIITSFHYEFSMTDIGSLNYFFGIYVVRESSGMFLSQRKYAAEILERAHMVYCNPSRTPVDTESKLGADGDQVSDPTFVEAEYLGVTNVVAETCWLRNLLRELHTPLSSATLVYGDNVSAVYLSSHPFQHQRTNHIDIDIHFVCDLVAAGQVRVLHVLSRYQYADIFTKGLPSALFEEFHTSLSVWCSPAQTARECC